MVWLHLDAVTALGALGTCATHLIEGADGGSTASNLKFCDFVRVASDAYGVNVQFLSGSYSDDTFIMDCGSA